MCTSLSTHLTDVGFRECFTARIPDLVNGQNTLLRILKNVVDDCRYSLL